MKHVIIPTLALVLVAGSLLQGCGKEEAESAPAGGRNGEHIVSVKTENIEEMPFIETIQVTGTVAAYEDVMVPADEGGRVLKWRVPLGARVSRGQVLVLLDTAIVRAAFDAAKAQYNIAQTSYLKQKKVYEQEAISELQLKTLEYQRDAALAQMNLSKERLDRMSIRSPINGVLNKRLVEEGEMSGPGLPIAHVVNTSTLKIVAGVPERYANSFRLGDRVEFTVDAVPGKTFKGKISFVGAAVEKDNRTVPIEVHVQQSGSELKPDMIASMEITLSTRANSIVIPEDYVQTVNIDEFIVYVLEDSVARERKVKVGGSSGGKVLITAGLEAGEELITLGHQNVANNQRVSVKN